VRLEGWDDDGFDGWDDVELENEGVQIGQRKGTVGRGSDCGLVTLGVDGDFEEDFDMLIAVWL
jgi:hypothetical protein